MESKEDKVEGTGSRWLPCRLSHHGPFTLFTKADSVPFLITHGLSRTERISNAAGFHAGPGRAPSIGDGDDIITVKT